MKSTITTDVVTITEVTCKQRDPKDENRVKYAYRFHTPRTPRSVHNLENFVRTELHVNLLQEDEVELAELLFSIVEGYLNVDKYEAQAFINAIVGRDIV